MLLKIRKTQKKGVLGKPTFEIYPELVLTEHEKSLIEHYHLQMQPLASKKMVSMFGNPLDTELTISVEDLRKGDSYKCKSLAEVIGYRSRLIEACMNLRIFLKAAESFEGVEEIDIDALINDNSDEV